MFGFYKLFLVLLGVFITNPCLAQSDNRVIGENGLPVPRFVSIRANQANIRHGPGQKYPVIFQFRKRSLPIEIIAEYGLWRKVRDKNNNIGWIHTALLRGQRYAITTTQKYAIPLRHKSSKNSIIEAYLAQNLIVRLKTCNVSWCYVVARNQKGWIRRSTLWGIYPFEYQN